jgi:menaquinone reductase, molybdopterin-binding-like subunit
MKLSRRDLLVWSAGAAAGLLATPVPWKILDDTSIWSQNWPWIPQPARCPVETRQSVCTLCPKGCGLRVRMAGGWAVGVAGLNTHPLSRGALCPLAYAAHQLNWHPQRLRVVQHRRNPSSWEQARAAFAKASKEGPVVIIDGYPGRAASALFETYTEGRDGSYCVVPSPEIRALTPYESWTGVPAHCLGYDLENTRIIVSFGAPLLDGWGTPGRFTRIWADRAAGRSDPELRLIQIDSSLSRTAARAWRWVRTREGTHAALASGLARALLEQNLVPAHGPIPATTLAESAVQCDISTEAILELARSLVAKSPTLVIARDNSPAIAALNVLLGSVGARGGVVRHSQHSNRRSYTGSEVQNARAVLIDSSVPWNFMPQTDAEVFRFAAWRAASTKADWLLPAPGFLEELTDVPTPPASSLASYAVAPPLVKSATEVHSTAQFLSSIDARLSPTEKMIYTRCEDLFRRRAGTVHAHNAIPISELASVQKLEEQLWQGAVWVGEPSPDKLPCRLQEWPSATPSSPPDDGITDWIPPVMPALASKLYVESTLREAPERRKA